MNSNVGVCSLNEKILEFSVMSSIGCNNRCVHSLGNNHNGQLGYGDNTDIGSASGEMGDNLRVISVLFTPTQGPSSVPTAEPTTIPTESDALFVVTTGVAFTTISIVISLLL